MEKEIISPTEPRKAWDGVPDSPVAKDVPVVIRSSEMNAPFYNRKYCRRSFLIVSQSLLSRQLGSGSASALT